VTRAFEWFVAGRYLRARHRHAFINIVTFISVLGVAAGVMALVLALAINNGFRQRLQSSLLGATPHVAVLEKNPSTGIAGWKDLAAKLSTLPGVASAAPALYGKVLVASPLQPAEATLKGVLSFPVPVPARDKGFPQVVLGAQLARRTGMTTGSVVRLLSPQGEMTPFGIRPAEFTFRVAALFESGFYDLDNQFAFVLLPEAQRVFQTGDVVNAVEIRLQDLEAASRVARAAENAAGPEFAATDWMEQNRQLLGALRLEKTVSVITIGLIQLVAALNILTALFMSVMEKRRDIAILLSMGARRLQIARLFLLQGLLIASAGSVIGLIAGYALGYAADRGRWIALDEEIYSLSFVPFEPRPFDALWIVAVALAVSLAASYAPARAASTTDPVETLRNQ
jgi:lipoprotein-releasing system permease protein